MVFCYGSQNSLRQVLWQELSVTHKETSKQASPEALLYLYGFFAPKWGGLGDLGLNGKQGRAGGKQVSQCEAKCVGLGKKSTLWHEGAR